MSLLAFDGAQLRESGLLIPGRVPLGPVLPARGNRFVQTASWGFLLHGARRGGWNQLFCGTPQAASDKLRELTPVAPNWGVAPPGGEGMFAGAATSAALSRDTSLPGIVTSSGDYKGAFSLLVVAAPIASATANTLFQNRYASGNTPQVMLTVNRYYAQGATSSTASSGAFTFLTMTQEGSNNARGVWATNRLDGRVHCWIGTKAAGCFYRLYEDGVQIGEADETARTSYAICDASANFALGGPSDTGFTTGSREPVYLLAEWDYELSVAESCALSRDPWQMVRPAL